MQVEPIPIRVLGPLTVTAADGESVDVGPRKLVELLVILTAERVPRSADHLAELLWRGSPPRSVAVTLQGYISRLRKALAAVDGVRIDTVTTGYVLRCDGSGTDLDVLERLSTDGLRLARTDPAAAAETLCRALDLWRGPPLGEVADIAEMAPEITRLEQMRADLTESAAETLLTTGEHRRAVTLLSDLLRHQPYREGAVRVLATALAHIGRPADGLAVIRDLRGRLADDLGLDPDPRTLAVEAELLDPASVVTRPVQVPEPVEQRTTMIRGRDNELKVLRAVLRRGSGRLAGAVVTGPSGIGKSSLVDAALDMADLPVLRTVGRPATDEPLRGLTDLFGVFPSAKNVDVTATDLVSATDDAIRSRLCAHGRVVLSIDDLQWMDLDSAQALGRVLAGMRLMPVTVVATSRDKTNPAARLIADALAKHGDLSDIALGPLDDTDLTQLVTHRLSETGLTLAPGPLVEQSLGNPLVALTLCDAMATGSASGEARLIPDAIGRRLDDLDPAALALATLLAVSGGALDNDILGDMGYAAGSPIRAALIDARFAGTEPDTALSLSHSRITEAVVSHCSPGDLARTHRRLAAALLARRPHELSSIATHLAAGADDPQTRARAVEAGVEAARAAHRSGADHQAVELVRRTLTLLDTDRDQPGTAHSRVETLRLGGSSAIALGDFDSAIRFFEEAATISRIDSDWPALAETALLAAPRGVAGYWSGYGMMHSGNPALVAEALGHDDVLDADTVVRLQAGEAARRTVLGLPGARDHLAVAAELCEPGSSAAHDVLLAEFLCRWTPADRADRAKIADELYRTSGGDVHRRATALHLQRVCALESADVRMARRISTEVSRVIATHPDTDLATMQLWWRVMLALLRGNFEQSSELTTEYAESVESLGDQAKLLSEASIATSESIALWLRGRLHEMLPRFDDLTESVDDDFALVIALGSAEAGDVDRALAVATEITADAASWSGPRVVVRVPLLVDALYMAWRTGEDLDRTRRIAARIAPFVEDWNDGLIVQWPGVVCVGPASLYRGSLGAIVGNDSAADDLEAAAHLADDTGARPFAERARARLAHLRESH
uniref:BTAD domain-containing putative transcriptional regulator n=1 Tax=Gordonia sp. B7-2 TaxID=3420932 RepID=UPI003D8A29E1